MEAKDFSRRSFLKISAGALAGMALLSVPRAPRAMAAAPETSQVRLADIPASCEDIARGSDLVAQNWKKLQGYADSLHDDALKAKVKGVLENPSPTFLSGYGAGDAAKVYEELQARGLVDPSKISADTLLPPIRNPRQSPQPFLTAPGSGYMSHHPYPGGLVTHTTANVTILLGIYHAYEDVFGYSCDYDTAVAGEILHDLAKPYVFQWQSDGSSLKEYTIGGQGAHHVLSVAESIYRGLPPEVVTAQACAHDHPGSEKDAAQVAGWLLAASILAGKDPVAYGLLQKDGSLREPVQAEGFLVHLGDHDWVLSGFSSTKCIAYLKEYGQKHLGIDAADAKTFHAFRNYVGSEVSFMRLYQLVSKDRKQADALVASLVTK